ncbi:hypothetical protein [Streptomyces flaveolus]|uniref:hypothetical protein n=1 Tax=Streptomyces flaveolus TaxID=67297 RepID=UPI0036FCDCA1
MCSTAAARELDVDLVRSVVEERVAWEKASLPRAAAAARIGGHWSDLVRMGKEGRITTGRGDRYLIVELDAMAAEADGEQYVTAQVAATDVLEIRADEIHSIEDHLLSALEIPPCQAGSLRQSLGRFHSGVGPGSASLQP